MTWFIIHLVLVVISLWPIKYFFNPEMDKPLVFTGVFFLLFLIFWLLFFFLKRKYFFKIPLIVGFLLFFIRESVKANLRVAYDIITPGFKMKPAIIAYKMRVKTDLEIVTLGSAITLTPGTLSIYISEDRKTLYIHEMYVPDGDLEKSRENIRDGFEKRILEIAR